MRYCFDIDGTICRTKGTDYANAQPIKEAIKRIRQHKRDGHEIVFQTARGTESGEDHRELTERQLEEWGVPCDALYFGKPAADRYVDNRGIAAHSWLRGTELQIYGVTTKCPKCECRTGLLVVNIPGVSCHVRVATRGQNSASPEAQLKETTSQYLALGWNVRSPDLKGGSNALMQTFEPMCNVCSGKLRIHVGTDVDTMSVIGIQIGEREHA